MLDTLKTTSPPVFRQSQPAAMPIRTVTALAIAKVHRTPRERALLAAQWILGRLEIEGRTASMAAAIFDCSPASVSRALTELNGTTADNDELLGFYWRHATSEEREKFVRANLLTVWDTIDRVTA
jgi:hypothetical protein